MSIYRENLAELNEEWTDAPEEPKEWYTINQFDGSVDKVNDDRCAWTDKEKESIAELGLRFGTREEAEQAVEKLKAWRRLKDKGFRFDGWEDSQAKDDFDMIWFTMKAKVWDVETQEALDLLFCTEDN